MDSLGAKDFADANSTPRPRRLPPWPARWRVTPTTQSPPHLIPAEPPTGDELKLGDRDQRPNVIDIEPVAENTRTTEPRPSAIRIDPKFAALCPQPTDEERRLLKDSITREGCREPLLLWRGLLVDGHTRHAICQELSASFKTADLDLDERDDVTNWIIDNQ